MQQSLTPAEVLDGPEVADDGAVDEHVDSAEARLGVADHARFCGVTVMQKGF